MFLRIAYAFTVEVCAFWVFLRSMIELQVTDVHVVEGKMYVSLMALPHFLTVPPQKSVRTPRPSPKAVARMLLFESEVHNIIPAFVHV